MVSGVACAVPELLLGLDQAIQRGLDEEVDRLESRLQEFIAWLDRLPTPLGVKQATAVRGLKVGPPAVPLPAEERKLLAEFREWFQGWLPVVKREAVVQ